MKLYIDTSVFGCYFEVEFELWTRKLFDQVIDGKFTAVVSDITLTELQGAPKEVRHLVEKVISENAEFVIANDEANELSDRYLKEKIVTTKFRADALHIAIATVQKVDVLTSWNFAHIVNLNRIRLYNSVNLKYGYSLIEIRSPREVIEI
jgi:predicted nucleic acid-binding protein